MRAGLPPTYVESLNHLKEIQLNSESPKYCETPKNHITHTRLQEEATFSPYGGGDQNHYYHQQYRGMYKGTVFSMLSIEKLAAIIIIICIQKLWL